MFGLILLTRAVCAQTCGRKPIRVKMVQNYLTQMTLQMFLLIWRFPRKRKTARFFGLGAESETLAIVDDSPDPQEIAMQRQELRMLLEQIERLPIRLREALILVSIDGRSQAEAAELLGVSEKAIETRIYRARQKLRDRLENF